MKRQSEEVRVFEAFKALTPEKRDVVLNLVIAEFRSPKVKAKAKTTRVRAAGAGTTTAPVLN